MVAMFVVCTTFLLSLHLGLPIKESVSFMSDFMSSITLSNQEVEERKT